MEALAPLFVIYSILFFGGNIYSMEEKIEYVICEHAVHQVKPESLRPPALTENFRTYCIVIIYSVFYSVPQRAISVLYRSVYCYILFRYLGFFLQRIQYDNSPVTQKTEITDIHYIIHYGEAETRDHHTIPSQRIQSVGGSSVGR